MICPVSSLIMASSLSSVVYVGLEHFSLSCSTCAAAVKLTYWVSGRKSILCGYFCWVTPCRTSSFSCSPLLFCLSGLRKSRNLSLLQSVALFWRLCFSSFVLYTTSVSGKSDWRRCSGKEINQWGPRWAIHDSARLAYAYLIAACLSIREHEMWTLNKTLFGHQGVQSDVAFCFWHFCKKEYLCTICFAVV